jgi:tetratricopeptide (TPR) repeat protein
MRCKDRDVTLLDSLEPRQRPAVEPAARRRHHCARRSGGVGMLSGSLALALAIVWILPQSTLAQTTPESLIAGAVPDKGPYYPDLSHAVARFREGNLEAARAHLTAARNLAPKLSPVEVMLANLLIDVGQTAAGRAELEKAVHLHPHDPEAFVRLAELDAADGRVTEIGLLYAKACDLADTFNESPKRRRQVQLRALSGAASVAESREQWSAARDYLQALARIEPDNAVVLQRLGKALFKLGEAAEARRALETANAADSKSIPADLTLAALYAQSGDKTHAEKCIQSVVEKGADSLIAQIGLARWMLQSGELDQAQAHAQRARQLDPDSLDAKVIAGVVARLRKDLDAAQSLLEGAHMQSPVNVDVNNQLALILLERPDEASKRRATEFAELNQRLYPKNVETAATLAWVISHQGRQAEAERLFSAISAAMVSGSPPVSGDAVYYLANFRADQGRTAEARRLLSLLLSRDVPSFYRQEAEALLARLDEPAAAATSTDEPVTSDTEKPDKTEGSADAVGDAPTSTDSKKPAQP